MKKRKGPPPPSRKQVETGRVLERATADAQAMQTIRQMLAAGAEATPIGARTVLRLPGDQRTKEFPSDLVERVKREPAPHG